MFVKYHKDSLLIKSVTTEMPFNERDYVIVEDPNITTTNPDYIKVYMNNGEVVVEEMTNEEKAAVDERKFQQAKVNLLNNLKESVKQYILRNYDQPKQNSDVVDSNYFALAIVQTNDTPITELEVKNKATIAAYSILQGQTTLADYVATKPANQQKYWDQLLKAFIRGIWLQQVKDTFRGLKAQIEAATNMSELPRVPFEELHGDFGRFMPSTTTRTFPEFVKLS